MRKIFTALLVTTFVAGCSAPAYIIEKANKDLVGSCLNLFLDSGVGRYQYVANASTGRAAFALASYGNQQACGMATNMSSDVQDNLFFSMPSFEKLEAVAIQRCENAKSPSIKTPCLTYARNNEIVWNPSMHIKVTNPQPDQKSQELKPPIQTLDINDAKAKCADLGFTPNTEGFGKCVLRITK